MQRAMVRYMGVVVGVVTVSAGLSVPAGAAATARPAAVVPHAQSSGRAIAVGGDHSCGLLANGTIRCWGLNDHGQLGNGSNDEMSLPVTVSSISTATSIGAGKDSSCAVLADHTVRCWGLNNYGQLGNGTDVDSNVPVAVAGITTAVAVGIGNNHGCALLSDHTVRCWGDGGFGQLGNGSINDSPTPVVVSGLSSARKMAVGDGFTCVVLSDGSVWCWGRNWHGELGNGSTDNATSPVPVSGISGATDIAAGANHACAVIIGATARCWGSNAYGQLGNGKNADALTPVTVSGMASAVAVVAGKQHSCALRLDRTVQCWGYNSLRQLGDGTTDPALTPVSVISMAGVVGLAASNAHTCAVLSSGTAMCWGDNNSGKLGNGLFGGSADPSPVLQFGRPDNDDFANAQVLNPAGSTVSTPTTNATLEADEPVHQGSGGASVWYSFTPTTSRMFAFDTCSSDFDTILDVYLGSTFANLSSVFTSDTACGAGGSASRSTFAAVAGATYRISVDGFQGATGNLTLAWSPVPPPANDNFAKAQVISGISGSINGSNAGATKQAGEPTPLGKPGGSSVWYRYTPPSSGLLYLDTCGSTFDTVLGVYAGAAVNALTAKAESDDGDCAPQSNVSLSVVGGTTYRIEVDGYNGSAGSVELSWSFLVPPVPVASLGSASAYEGDSGTHTIEFPVTLDSPALSSVTLHYKVFAGSGDTATAGSDFTATTGTVTLNPVFAGSTATVAQIPVTIKSDTAQESNERFSVQLTSASGVTLRTNLTHGTILNDDKGTGVRLTVSNVSIVEGFTVATAGGSNAVQFHIHLSNPVLAGKTVKVTYHTVAGTATGGSAAGPGVDFLQVATTTVTFTAGQSDKVVTVRVFPDGTGEANETFTLAVTSATNATLQSKTGTGTILNDE